MAGKYKGKIDLHHFIATGGNPKDHQSTSGEVRKSGVRRGK